jgi:ferredoxin-NADP reductase
MLRGSLPDIARHDVYLCGPPGLAEESYDALREAGVPHRRIHHESFEFRGGPVTPAPSDALGLP